MKRGQLTLLVLIGLVLVILVSVLLYVQQNGAQVAPATRDTQANVAACLDQVTREGVYQLGLRGGRLEEDGVWMGMYAIAWAMNATDNLVPTKSELAHELEDMLSLAAPLCFAQEYVAPGSTMEGKDVEATVTIDDTAVTVLYSMDLTITTGETTARMEEYASGARSDIGRMRRLADTFVDTVLASGTLDTDPLLEEDIAVQAGRTDGTSALVTMETDSGIFKLALPLHALPVRIERPKVTEPSPVTMSAGERRIGIIQAEDAQGTLLTFEAVSPIITIDDNGAYILQTSPGDEGTHDIPIIITTADGASATTILKVIVQ